MLNLKKMLQKRPKNETTKTKTGKETKHFPEKLKLKKIC